VATICELNSECLRTACSPKSWVLELNRSRVTHRLLGFYHHELPSWASLASSPSPPTILRHLQIRMETTISLPSELIMLVALHLHTDVDRSTLQACAAASRSWLVVLRPILFETVKIIPVIDYPQPSQTTRMVLSHARHVRLNWCRPDSLPGEEAVLKTLRTVAPHLSDRFYKLTIWLMSKRWNWDSVPTIMSNPDFLICRDHVTHLSLISQGLQEAGIGASLLSMFPNVKTLHCTSPYTAASTPLALSMMKLESCTWTGNLARLFDSLTSGPIIGKLQSLDLYIWNQEQQWKTLDLGLPQLTALINLRLHFGRWSYSSERSLLVTNVTNFVTGRST
jgi:hypothetical protein